MKRILTLIIIVLALSTGCSKFAKVQKSNDYEYKLKMANQYYDAKKYTQAQQLYEELFPVFKGTERFEDLYYKYAYCSYYLNDFLSAENLFKSFVEVFPNSKREEEMSYMRAFTYYKQSPKVELDQTNTSRTIGLMQTFINIHSGSSRVKEATEIIDKCRIKLEMKDAKSAELYYNLGQFKAAAIAYNGVINNYPDSDKSDWYKLQIIKAYYEYALLSVEEKKEERFQQVVMECADFSDRFTDSKLQKEVEKYSTQSQNNIKTIKK